MNFPGLTFSWVSLHRCLKKAGLVNPWNLEECKKHLSASQGRVLVVANTALGDSLLCLPLLETLSAHLGSDKVGFLVRAPYAELYEKLPSLHRVHRSYGKFRGFASLGQQLKSEGYRVALIANATEPDMIPFLWWSGLRGFLRYRSRDTFWRGWFANQNMIRQPCDSDYAKGHAIDNTLAMAEALGVQAVNRQMRLPMPPPAQARHKPLIIVHPGASRPTKQWPVERWAHVASMLASDFSCEIGITGGLHEKTLACNLSSALQVNATDFSGCLSLTELATLQQSAAIFLSGDTGPYHLAVATGCPTVTLFAPKDRGSSAEACGPHAADPTRHKFLQTAAYETPISTIPAESVLHAARAVLQHNLQTTP